ncbi:MAG: GNAT family N-acetyltransferase [Pseudohongiellaceae bacterium]|nr:GNAT family N-acetyltransferase [Pseudohongiellaceae bacterium]
MLENEPLSLRQATAKDVGPMVALINRAYRGDSSRVGWTTEADLLTGDRITQEEASALISKADTVVLLALDGANIIGTVELQQRGEEAYLGMLVIDPQLQARGLGKQLLAAAEQFVLVRWQSKSISLSVIGEREPLIAYYERRGYMRTGELQRLPSQLGQSKPIVEGLSFETMRKSL